MKQHSRLYKILTTSAAIIIFFGLLIASIVVTQPDFGKLLTSAPKARDILGQLLSPDLITRQATKVTVSQAIPIPCGAAASPQVPATGPRLVMDPVCGNPKDNVTVHGYDLPKNAEFSIRWILANGQLLSIRNSKRMSMVKQRK